MTERKYGAVVIGTGQSGPSLAARLANEGMRTAIIERKLFGGTCVGGGQPGRAAAEDHQVVPVLRPRRPPVGRGVSVLFVGNRT